MKGNIMTDKPEKTREPLDRETNNPRETYKTPANILTDETLNHEQKVKLLESWKNDVDSRLSAQAEGMGQAEPISAENEADLADEERLLDEALRELE